MSKRRKRKPSVLRHKFTVGMQKKLVMLFIAILEKNKKAFESKLRGSTNATAEFCFLPCKLFYSCFFLVFSVV